MKVAFFDTKPYDRQYFEAAKTPGVELDFHEFRLNPQTAKLVKGVEAVCAFVSDRLDRPTLKTLQENGVKHIAMRCAGYNNVDTAAAKELGMTVSCVPAYSPHAVAEHALALLMTLNRKTHRAYNRVRELNFSLNGLVGWDLYGKSAGVLGTGKIGKIFAEILKGIGMKVRVYDVRPDAAWAEKAGVQYVTMDEVLADSDLVSLHMPLIPQTNHIINEATLGKMKKGAYLIDVSRGKLIDTKALIAALKSGKLGGVGLDVYEGEVGIFYEDLSGQMLKDDDLSRLLTFPNVLITSHQAFLTHEALTEIAHVTMENLKKLAAGQPLMAETMVAW